MIRAILVFLFGLAMLAGGFAIGDSYGRAQEAKALVTRVLTSLNHRKVLNPPDEAIAPVPGFFKPYKDHLWRTKKN